jgi:pilus assembly protein CpaF
MFNEDIREEFNRYLIKETEFLKVKDRMTEDQLKLFIDQAIEEMCEDRNIEINVGQRNMMIQSLVSSVISLGPIRPLMEDQNITEIMINGYDRIYVQKDGRIVLTDIKFEDNIHLLNTIQKILVGANSNKRVDESSPYVDFSLADGSRVNVILSPCSMVGPVMTIRKFRKDIESADDLVRLKMIDQNIADFLIAAMKAKLNIVFCGSTGAGKTTALNVFSKYIPEEERIITIEDTAELLLRQEHVVSLASKPSNIEGKGEIRIRDLFVNSLRMRPDRIIIGEVRGDEMLDMIQAISSGHSGSLAIIHAESPEDCFSRMLTMMLMSGIRLSTEEMQRQIALSIDVLVHVELFMDGVRRVTRITELSYDENSKKVGLRDIFIFVEKETKSSGEINGEWKLDHQKPNFNEKFRKKRVSVPKGFFQE